MDTLKVTNNEISPIYKDWENTINQFTESLGNIPVVASGAVPIDQAQQWLQLAAKIHSPYACERLIQQSSGLGAKDLRTLIAHDRNEYYPDDSAGEVYSRKWLASLAAPNGPNAERERVLTNITRSYLLKNYDVERNIQAERAMASTGPNRKAAWLIGQPGMVGHKSGNTFLFDIQFDKNTNEINQSDLIRLHYYDLVANNSGCKADHLSLVKVSVDSSFADSLIALSRLSKDSEKNISQLGEAFSNLPPSKFDIKVHQIEKQPELYREIISTGQKHWQNILAGNPPEAKLDPPLTLDKERELSYIDKAKRFLTATQTVKAAEDARKAAIEDFVSSMQGFDISDNFLPPYLGALIRKYDYFDAEGAANYMEQNLGIDPGHLRLQDINVERLKEAYIRMGGDISQFYETSTPDKKAIETAAEQIGFDLSSFYTRQMRAIVNPKTRGPVYDAIKDIRESVANHISTINESTATSPIMDNKNLLPGSDDAMSKQAKMKI